jgi:hypothetical protein
VFPGIVTPHETDRSDQRMVAYGVDDWNATMYDVENAWRETYLRKEIEPTRSSFLDLAIWSRWDKPAF